MLFVQDQYKYLLTNAMHSENCFITQFANQEFLIHKISQVQEQRCVVVGSLTASSDQQIQLLLLLHSLRQARASSIILFSPYLGYQRQDKCDTSNSCGLRWADAMLSAVGVDQIVSIEPHNVTFLSSLQVPVYGYSAADLFESEMRHFVSLGFGFVFPDTGAYQRYNWILEKFPMASQGSFVKRRIYEMLYFENFQGKINNKVIIYDDILDSGLTLVQVCIALRQMGVEEIVVFVTHAFFHGQAWQDLWNLGVKVLYCTNSLPAAHSISHVQIQVKSVSCFLQKFL